MGNGPREPSADLRLAASGLHEMFTALLEQGFTEDQALTMLARVINSGRNE